MGSGVVVGLGVIRGGASWLVGSWPTRYLAYLHLRRIRLRVGVVVVISGGVVLAVVGGWWFRRWR